MNASRPSVVFRPYAYALFVASGKANGMPQMLPERNLQVALFMLPDLLYPKYWLLGWVKWLRALRMLQPRAPVVVQIHKRRVLFVAFMLIEALLLELLGHETYISCPTNIESSWILRCWRRWRPERVFVGSQGLAELQALMEKRSGYENGRA